MIVLNCMVALLFASTSVLGDLLNHHDFASKYVKRSPQRVYTKDGPRKRQTSEYLTKKTAKFAVDGSALPEVDFNIGESYSGLLPISSDPNDPNQLFFWFFPSSNPLAKKEITIWLNGGPGCSSLNGLFQENGPFLWQPGTYQPFQNTYSWVNLTNMVYIDQPVSTGFSTGNITVDSEVDVANQFKGFWKNFIDTFTMQDFKIYITGESYAGQYIPYIAASMLDEEDTKYFNVKGIHIINPLINDHNTMTQAPVLPALQHFQNVIGLNDTFMAEMVEKANSCGFTDFFNTYSDSFPPPGPIPLPPEPYRGCDMYDNIYNAVYLVNPCFNIYHLTDYCPYLWDELGFPSLAAGPNNYFNRSDVQEQLHVPPTNYFVCAGGNNLFGGRGGTDKSVPSALGPLPSVIDRTNNVLIAHGLLDFLLFANGTIITIQNMTWNGQQGFQTRPSATDNFYVPYHQSLGEILILSNSAIPYAAGVLDTAGAGIQGKWHTERGLTFVTVNLAGHEIAQYTPGAAYRMMEFFFGEDREFECGGGLYDTDG